MHNDVVTVALASSKFAPVAIGFFGLGTGYLVAGGQALFTVNTWNGGFVRWSTIQAAVWDI